MGGRGRPMVGAAVPCRPHGIGRGDQENVERGLDWIYRIVQDWGDAVHDLPARAPEPFAAENAAVRVRAWDQWRREVRRAYAARMGWTLYRLYAVRKSLQARFLPLLKSKPSRFGAS